MYTIVAAVIAGFFVLVGCEDFRERYINIPTGIFIVIFMGKDYVPMSIGISLLINLLNIVAMIIPIYGNIINIENRKKNGWK